MIECLPSIYRNILTYVVILLLGLTLAPQTAIATENDVAAAQSVHSNIEQLAHTQGAAKIKLLKQISQQLQSSNTQQAINYAQQAISLSIILAQPKLTADLYFTLLEATEILNDNDKIKTLLDIAISHAKQYDLADYIASFYNELARLYWKQSNFELALDALNHALAAFKQVDNQVEIATTLNNIGIIQRNLGDYNKSLKAYSAALDIRKQIGDNEKIAFTLNNIGVLYQEFNYYEEALEVLLNAVALFEELGLSENLADPINNIGLVYEKMGQLELALSFLEKSLVLELELGNERGIAYSLNNIGSLHRKMKLYDQSITQLNKSLVLAEKLGEKSLISRVHREIAQNNFEVKQFEQAQKHINTALIFSIQIKDKEQQKQNHQLQANILAATNHFKEAYSSYKQYKNLSDQIDNDTSKQLFIKFQHRIEIEKRENEITLLKKQNEINLLDLEKQNAVRNVIIISVFAFLIIASLLNNRRLNNRRLKNERSLNKKLTELDLLKNQFLTNTTHELLTPLNGIIGLSDSLIIQEKDQETKETMSLISACGRQLEKLVNNILDLSNLTKDNMELNFERINLAKICSEVIELLAPAAKKKQNSLELTFQKKNILIQADEIRLRQVIFNLINNAIKFTDSGLISIDASLNNNEVVLKISDSGIGIPKNKLKRIFESFEQVDGSNTRFHGGAGLGLSITKKLVELHRGRIWVESIEGKGSQFFIAFPVG